MKRKDASCCICKLKCQEDSTLALALTYLILNRNLNWYPNGVLFMQGYGQGSIICGILQGWTGKLFFSRGGKGQGQKSMGWGGEPPPPQSAGRGGKG